MNVQRRYVDVLASTTPTRTRYPAKKTSADTLLPEQAERIAYLKARMMARTDGEARIARVERLKAEIEAGTYQIDATFLAQCVQAAPGAMALINLEVADTLNYDDQNSV
ncbi:hypothetical protein KDW_28930 [Dictyobacter vulcani]|uniref:Anti-sigma-28 factor FlgM C-terminal domain-containing protein n=1 Tax=Dictyobacter vulcani TaxID=2607529 RepID=A0A5J4KQR1_9CHLR|nr:flagellar biosynthesis anti-sigma factor FlgM [Dictyobacter vulcani]GER88731.1 hypothetical protein KDW_28930 [Dictyobacter vulcani]